MCVAGHVRGKCGLLLASLGHVLHAPPFLTSLLIKGIFVGEVMFFSGKVTDFITQGLKDTCPRGTERKTIFKKL